MHNDCIVRNQSLRLPDNSNHSIVRQSLFVVFNLCHTQQGRKCVEIHIFSPLYYTGLITPLEHIVCFQSLLSGKSVVAMVRRIVVYYYRLICLSCSPGMALKWVIKGKNLSLQQFATRASCVGGSLLQKHIPICLFMGIWKGLFFFGLCLSDSNNFDLILPTGFYCTFVARTVYRLPLYRMYNFPSRAIFSA